jgi:hypothetical protein
MELDCTNYDGIVKFDGFNKNNPYTIRISVMYDGVITIHSLTKYGQTSVSSYNKCVIFPKGKTTWEGFHKPFKDGDIITDGHFDSICIFKGEGGLKGTVDFYCGINDDDEFCIKNVSDQDEHFGEINDYNFATEEEKEKLFQAIKDNGYRWDAETKTLEKLTEPKFKDGDVLFVDCSDDEENKLYQFIFILKETGFYGKWHAYCYLDEVGNFSSKETYLTDNKYNPRFATEEEKEKLFKAIKDNGYKWNEETKTLEKLNQPNFKVGNWVVQGCNILKIRCVGNEYYCFETVMGYAYDMLVSEMDSLYHLWTIQDAKDGDVLHSPSHNLIWIYKDNKHYYACVNMNYETENVAIDGLICIPHDACPATKDEQTILFAKMKEADYKWNAETKTLEKLPQFKIGDRIKNKNVNLYHTVKRILGDSYIVDNNSVLDMNMEHLYELTPDIKPKFKVGDRIKKDKDPISGVITNISDDGSYKVEYKGGGVTYVYPAYQDDWELVPDKFDINTLVPFESRVLVRDNVKEKWHPGIWGFYDDNSYNSYPYKLIGDISLYCIPYEGNEHLLGKTDDCDEYYKTWL